MAIVGSRFAGAYPTNRIAPIANRAADDSPSPGGEGRVRTSVSDVVFLQAAEHHRAFQRRLIAELNILILGRQFEQTLANRSQLSLGQLGKFIDDVRRTHGEKLTRMAGFVMPWLPRNTEDNAATTKECLRQL
jgi:hypothetical protein